MYPGQTSFMPVQVALARWLETVGWRGAITSNYPYWYLGTTPFRHLTGPVLPGLLVGLHRLLPGFNWFEWLWWLMLGFYLISLGGVYWLVRELGGGKRAAAGAAGFYGFGWFTVWSLSVTDGLSLISFASLIYGLVLGVRLLKKSSRKRLISLGIVISFVLLLNSLMVPSLVLGMGVICLAVGRWKKLEARLKLIGKVLMASWLGVTLLWYGWSYWWRLLLAPSFAGKATFKVIGEVGKLLPMVLALSLAVLGGRIVRLKSRLAKFSFYWLLVFGFLSLMRFMADPDFWLDWLVYGWELQLGIAIGLGWWLGRAKNRKDWFLRGVSLGVAVLVWLGLFKNVSKGMQRYVTEGVEYRIGEVLSRLVKPGERVFLSGSTVFWLNGWFDIAQVRGGVDKASVNPDWRQAAWEIREGTEVERSLEWLDRLKVTWLVVHGPESEEVYDDFKHPEKFTEVEGLKKVYDEAGDQIYKLVD